MKKYYSFILVALITLLLNIFLLFNISAENLYKKELLFIEFMILLSIVVAIKLYYCTKASNLFGVFFFVLYTFNALYLFILNKTVVPTTLLLVCLLGLTLFMSKRGYHSKRRHHRTTNKVEEINMMIGKETEPAPKIIIENKKFVASKAGKVFFEEGSSFAKRIKAKNRIYFDTKAQAKKKGYKEYK